MANSVSQALSSEGSEALADSEIKSQIENHVRDMMAEGAFGYESQKTNLEERNYLDLMQASSKHHKKHHKKHHRHHNKPGAAKNVGVTMIPTALKSAPAAKTLLATKGPSEWEKWSQNVDVPIDEVKAITLHVSPTYDLDHIESVTLKSFRKIVGYDTFNSIRKGDRNEKKDTSDYYNVTVSMMIRRIPEDVAHPPVVDPYNGGVPLASQLDKGFPYDDGDNTTDDQTPNWKGKKQAPGSAQLVGKLNGENITKGALVNLIRDTDAPIT